MTRHNSQIRYGAKSVESRRTGLVPGLNGPPKRSGGTLTSSCGTRGGGSRLHATGTPNTIKILQWNAEGVAKKKIALEKKLKEQDIKIACIQETHLTDNMRFAIRGYQVIRHDRKDHKGGVMTLVKNDYPTAGIKIDTQEQSEIQQIKVCIGKKELLIFNCYCPPNKELHLDKIKIQEERCLVLGDFNSHSQSWGYGDMDKRGETVENWQIETKLQLLYDDEDEDTYFSRAWKTTSTPDLTFATDDIAKTINRTVQPQLGGSDHRPIITNLYHQNENKTQTIPRWNYKRAKWKNFEQLTDSHCKNINCKTKNVNKSAKELTKAILKAAKESIPRGARKNYIPLWTDDLNQLSNEVSEAREKAEADPCDDNITAYKEAEATFKKEMATTSKMAWKEKTHSLNFEKDGNKLWKLTKALNREPNHYAPPALEKEGELVSPQQAADLFMEQFKKISDNTIEKELKKRVKKECRKQKMEIKEAIDEVMTKKLTMEELESSLKMLKTKKSPGPDEVTNEMLIHLGKTAKKKLLQLYNSTWKTGKIPDIWKKAFIVPIKKEGKQANEAANYRPISLTSCMCKLVERIINSRLMWYLENYNVLINEQAGFRRHRSTENQVTYISQEIEDSFQDGKKTIVVWVDFEKAFDKVWKKGLVCKLQKSKVSHNMLNWIQNYLKTRKARVTTQGHKSREAKLKHGVPQGGVLSPTLFLLYVNDIKETMCRGVKMSMYADDLALISSDQNLVKAQHRMQITLDNIKEWTNNWAMKINAVKTKFTIFSLSPKDEKAKLRIEDHELEKDDAPKYLGVHFDPRLTWKNQISNSQKVGVKRTQLLKKLAGTTWGASSDILKQTYTGYVRPAIEYGISAWGNCSKAQMEKLDRVQNSNMRIISGGMKSTPIHAMETITGLTSLSERRESKILKQYTDVKAMTDQPLHARAQQKKTRRLKRSHFIERAQQIEKDHELDEIMTQKRKANNRVPIWKRQNHLKIKTSVGDISTKQKHSEEIKKSVQKCIDQNYPEKKWTRIYTDGSCNKEHTFGGLGVHIEYTNGQQKEISKPTGTRTSIYKSEADAIHEAVKQILSENEKPRHIVILTDAKNILEDIMMNFADDIDTLVEDLMKLSNFTNIVLQWIPGHCGILGNQIADQLAKAGSRMQQPSPTYSTGEINKMAKFIQSQRWREKHPEYNMNDPIKVLDRKEQVIIFRLRTGHNQLKEHMWRMTRAVASGQCDCGLENENGHHVLMECPRYNQLRRNFWPDPTPYSKKLYGSEDDLRTTVGFIHQTGLTV